MDYISVNETAKRWSVSVRRVQKLCEQGRVAGVIRFGRSWQIPKGAEKPDDPRCRMRLPGESLSDDLARIITATHISAPRDNPDAVLDTVGEERLRRIHEGALSYARGDFERTLQCYQKNRGDDAAQLGASALAIAAAISLGDYPRYLEMEAFLKRTIQANGDSDTSVFVELALSGGYLGAMAPGMVPDWLKEGDFSALSPQVKPDAASKRAKYFQCIDEYRSALDVAQTALAFCHSEREISFPVTYLTLLCAAACFATDRMKEAERYLLRAMHNNLPHGFITPFAEYVPLFGGMIERLIEREYPASLDAVLGQWKRTFGNWIKFHNQFTKDNITTILSLREYELALLASRRVPYAKIAEQHCISVSRLKSIMEVVYGKLFVNNRSELAKFIL